MFVLRLFLTFLHCFSSCPGFPGFRGFPCFPGFPVLAWPGPVWSGLVWFGLDWSGLVWSGLVRPDQVICMYVCMYVCTHKASILVIRGDSGRIPGRRTINNCVPGSICQVMLHVPPARDDSGDVALVCLFAEEAQTHCGISTQSMIFAADCWALACAFQYGLFRSCPLLFEFTLEGRASDGNDRERNAAVPSSYGKWDGTRCCVISCGEHTEPGSWPSAGWQQLGTTHKLPVGPGQRPISAGISSLIPYYRLATAVHAYKIVETHPRGCMPG